MGPMFAGKSTELLRRMRRNQISGKLCLSVKYAGDSRYSGSDRNVITHDFIKMEAISVHTLSELKDHWKSFDCIGIDEGQFYKDIVSWAEFAADSGKIVIVSGLSGTF